MNNQLVTVHNGKVTTSSLIIAQHFKKEHRNVIRAISNAECSPEFSRLNFEQSKYKSERGREYPCFLITRDGFMFLVMGFTGKEAAMWKERFINAFNAMEAKLREPEINRPVIDHLRGKTLKMDINYNGTLSFHVEEPRDQYADFANAIRDPSNVGLKEETILMVADACIEALKRRASRRQEKPAEIRQHQKPLLA